MENWKEFDENISLWNIVPSGLGTGLGELRKLIDYIFIEHPHKLPSILITGAEGKRTHARALINSLAIETIKNCPSRYFDAGISSRQFFHDSSPNSAYIIENIHEK